MATYRVFNENNARVEVTDQELDEAAAGSGALATHLANAAGLARRRELVGRLRATLGAAERRQKLAAARALLALDDRQAVAPLREAAARDEDAVAAGVFRGIALRLEGVAEVRRAWAEGDRDPALAGLLASIYNGPFDLVPDDVSFLLDAVSDYLANQRPWIAKMSRDEWKSDLYVLVKALARESTRPLLAAERERARAVLGQVAAARADRDTKKEARAILDAL